uniref:Uncharacterized protein ycf35 n=1 Tax=Thuretia quercifolia TaxID=189650 RepID=A0A1Z1MKS2_9FLOR|nr:hypothetical protein [Thuretia quercifolia]ARW66341.1 hypothetical protein [Thuretia quercifolia]
MSHFSKIKTNISDLEMLTKTLNDLGFVYSLEKKISQVNKISVFNKDIYDKHLFDFCWNGREYMLLADLFLWSLDVSIDYFLEKLTQQYAYNIIIKESLNYGFDNKSKILMKDGSIKLLVQKWHNYEN